MSCLMTRTSGKGQLRQPIRIRAQATKSVEMGDKREKQREHCQQSRRFGHRPIRALHPHLAKCGYMTYYCQELQGCNSQWPQSIGAKSECAEGCKAEQVDSQLDRIERCELVRPRGGVVNLVRQKSCEQDRSSGSLRSSSPPHCCEVDD